MNDPSTPSIALITGVTGQDGAYLARQLLDEGLQVVGSLRPGAGAESLWRLAELGIAKHPQLHLEALDLSDASVCRAFIYKRQPNYIFHFAGQTRVADSFRDPLASVHINGLGTLHLLEALRLEAPGVPFVFSSSAELFGNPGSGLQSEVSSFHPRNPYAVSKLFAHAATVCYRESYGLHTSCAILFNHESELRDASFVTRKITLGVARIVTGQAEEIALGNLNVERDFGYAPDYVTAIRTMVRQSIGDDYVLATGIGTSIRAFVGFAFAAAGIEIVWRGTGVDEVGIERASGKRRVLVDPTFFRPQDASALLGDASKARSRLNFVSTIDVATLAQCMVEADLQRIRA